MQYFFKSRSLRELRKLPTEVQEIIICKLDFYTKEDTILSHAQKLSSPYDVQWRIRIGKYRVVFEINMHEVNILSVGHRKDIYR